MDTNIRNHYYSFQALRTVKVDDRLIRGNAISTYWEIKKIKQAGVTQIIDLRNTSFICRPIEKLLCKIFGIKYINHRFSHRATTIPNRDYFKKINQDIINNKGKTYIHCEYGKHRTGIVIAIYEKLHSKKSITEIIKEMINNGYDDIIKKGKSKKEQKYIRLYKQMIDQYFT